MPLLTCKSWQFSINAYGEQTNLEQDSHSAHTHYVCLTCSRGGLRETAHANFRGSRHLDREDVAVSTTFDS